MFSLSLLGERRIRVHTLCLPVVNSLSDVFAGADVQAISGLLACMGTHHIISRSFNFPLKKNKYFTRVKLIVSNLNFSDVLSHLMGYFSGWKQDIYIKSFPFLSNHTYLQ